MTCDLLVIYPMKMDYLICLQIDPCSYFKHVHSLLTIEMVLLSTV